MFEDEINGLSLGPTVDVFFETCLQDRPFVYFFAWATSGLAVVATLCFACKHLSSLRRTAICLQRGYYSRIVLFPVIFGITSFVNLFCPRAWVLAHLVQVQFEAIAISTFGTILFMLLAIESLSFVTKHADEQGQSVTADDGSEVTGPSGREQSSVAALITEALRAQGPRKHFAVPPLCCLCRPILKQHDLSALNLLWVSWMVRQYAYTSVVLGACVMWAALALRTRQAMLVGLAYRFLLAVSGMVAVYGLVILYLSTKKLLRHWNTTMKFICIKGMLLVTILQELILKLTLKALHDDSRSCLMEPGHPTDLEHLTHFWNSYLMSLEAIFFAWLVARAFPVEEIRDFAGHHLDLVELELEQSHRSRKIKSVDEEDSGSDRTSEASESLAEATSGNCAEEAV